jgi:hypothetical protein
MIRSVRRLLIFLSWESVVVPPAAVLCSASIQGGHLSGRVGFSIVFFGFVAAASFLGFLAVLKRFADTLEQEVLQQSKFLDSLPSALATWSIAVAAGVSLFLELAIIRWQASMFEFLRVLQELRPSGVFRWTGHRLRHGKKPRGHTTLPGHPAFCVAIRAPDVSPLRLANRPIL